MLPRGYSGSNFCYALDYTLMNKLSTNEYITNKFYRALQKNSHDHVNAMHLIFTANLERC